MIDSTGNFNLKRSYHVRRYIKSDIILQDLTPFTETMSIYLMLAIPVSGQSR